MSSYLLNARNKMETDSFSAGFDSFIDSFYMGEDMYDNTRDTTVDKDGSTVVDDNDGCVFIIKNNIPPLDFTPILTEDFKEITHYDIQYPQYFEEYRLKVGYHDLFSFILQLTLNNRKITPYYNKVKVPYSKYTKSENNVIENVRVYSKVNPGYYRKLVYINYEHDCSEYFNYPMFELSDEIYKADYAFLSHGALSVNSDKVGKENMYFFCRDFKDDFYYVGNKRFALITRSENYSRDHDIAVKKENSTMLSTTRYKRKFGVLC